MNDKLTPREPPPEMLEAGYTPYHLEMSGVREYAEGYGVVLTNKDNDSDGRLTVRAFNEGRYNCTDVDLLDIIAWVRANHPDLLMPITQSTKQPAPATTDTVKLENAGYAAISETAESGEYPPRLVSHFQFNPAPHAAQAPHAPTPMVAGYTADQMRAYVDADRAQRQEYPEAAQVCAEAYQVVGSLLDELGVFETPEAVKILDNLSEHRLVHKDVLPWPRLAERAQRVPLTDEQMLQCVRSVGLPIPMGLTRDVGPYEVTKPTYFLERLVRAIERAHGIGAKP